MLSANWKALLAKHPKLAARVKAKAKPKEQKEEKKENKTTSAASSGGDVSLSRGKQPAASNAVVNSSQDSKGDGKTPELTTYLAMDCEMVGVGPGGSRHSLARCSIVNFHGEVVYDKYIKQREPVTDYRTHISGIRPWDVSSKNPNAIDFKQCQQEVAEILKGRILIGHAIKNDLQCLLLSHPRHSIRDTSTCKLLCPQRPKALKQLVQEHLGIEVQTGEHDSVEDARSVLALYKLIRNKWEAMIARKQRVMKLRKARQEAKAARKRAAFEKELEEAEKALEAAKAAKKAKLTQIPSAGAAGSSDEEDFSGSDLGSDDDDLDSSDLEEEQEREEEEEIEGSGVRVVPRKEWQRIPVTAGNNSLSTAPPSRTPVVIVNKKKRKQPEPTVANGTAKSSSGRQQQQGPANKKQKR